MRARVEVGGLHIPLVVDFSAVAKRLFAVRSFKGQSPEVIRERFRLVTGLVRDVVDGKLSQQTAMRLSREIATRLHEGGPLAPGPKLTAKQVKRGERVLLAIFGSHGAPTQHPRIFPRLTGTLRQFPEEEAAPWAF